VAATTRSRPIVELTHVSDVPEPSEFVAATQWLKDNGKRAFLGEFAGGANPVCQSAVTGTTTRSRPIVELTHVSDVPEPSESRYWCIS
jgi:hypothetical protein